MPSLLLGSALPHGALHLSPGFNVDSLLEVVDSGHVDSIFDFPIPLLVLIDVVATQMEAL